MDRTECTAVPYRERRQGLQRCPLSKSMLPRRRIDGRAVSIFFANLATTALFFFTTSPLISPFPSPPSSDRSEARGRSTLIALADSLFHRCFRHLRDNQGESRYFPLVRRQIDCQRDGWGTAIVEAAGSLTRAQEIALVVLV